MRKKNYDMQVIRSMPSSQVYTFTEIFRKSCAFFLQNILLLLSLTLAISGVLTFMSVHYFNACNVPGTKRILFGKTPLFIAGKLSITFFVTFQLVPP